jgi:hypothetical protein
MSYSVILTRKDGQIVRTDICNAPTPSRGDIVPVDVEDSTVKAHVGGIETSPPKKPWSQSIDHVTATEI